jgi:putative hydrolase of the HAD superfamily
MIKQASISTLIFDFGGVLINLDMQKCINSFNLLGATEVTRHLGQYGQSGFFLRFERGEISIPEFRNHIRQLSTGNPSDTEIDSAWMDFLLDIPASKINILKELRKRFRIVMLSNTNKLHIEAGAREAFAVHGTSMQELFDYCYLSYEIGMNKPDRDIFEYLLKQENVRPENCLFLDDGPKNIQTASELGIQTRLIEPGSPLDFLLTL